MTRLGKKYGSKHGRSFAPEHSKRVVQRDKEISRQGAVRYVLEWERNEESGELKTHFDPPPKERNGKETRYQDQERNRDRSYREKDSKRHYTNGKGEDHKESRHNYRSSRHKKAKLHN